MCVNDLHMTKECINKCIVIQPEQKVPGRGVFILAWGRYKVLLHVWAVGTNEFDTSVKLSEGCSSNPSTGSSSVPVTNCSTWPSVIAPLLPPKVTLEYLCVKQLEQ